MLIEALKLAECDARWLADWLWDKLVRVEVLADRDWLNDFDKLWDFAVLIEALTLADCEARWLADVLANAEPEADALTDSDVLADAWVDSLNEDETDLDSTVEVLCTILCEVLKDALVVSNSDSITVSLKKLVKVASSSLREKGLKVKDVSSPMIGTVHVDVKIYPWLAKTPFIWAPSPQE